MRTLADLPAVYQAAIVLAPKNVQVYYKSGHWIIEGRTHLGHDEYGSAMRWMGEYHTIEDWLEAIAQVYASVQEMECRTT